VKQNFYFDKIITHRIYQNDKFFGVENNYDNLVICFSVSSRLQNFSVLVTNTLPSLALYVEPTQCLAMYRYDANGNRQENITDWALAQFRQQHDNQAITKEQLFYYVYAVLHAPAYRSAYELNLKRDFPRIPFYADFAKYAAAGRQLAALHINYETIEPYPLQRVDKQVGNDFVPKAKLKADKANHCIEIDEIAKLNNVPEAAWDYKLGNRSALEWVLDQYKPSKPSDPTIAAHFNTYQFADYKEQVIDLLMRVCRVSVETMQIVETL
jgi:predicted helicase